MTYYLYSVVIYHKRNYCYETLSTVRNAIEKTSMYSFIVKGKNRQSDIFISSRGVRKEENGRGLAI